MFSHLDGFDVPLSDLQPYRNDMDPEHFRELFCRICLGYSLLIQVDMALPEIFLLYLFQRFCMLASAGLARRVIQLALSGLERTPDFRPGAPDSLSEIEKSRI